jgi:phenylpropionate dioxygenase-like ring-hydroxylating dioxygenase large terminal subunit
LECRYHSWQFDEKGKCVSNPQADGPKAEALVTTNSRSCLQSYPTRVEQGLLWVWPQANAWLESLKEPPPLFDEGPQWFGMRQYGFMVNPISFAVLVENSLGTGPLVPLWSCWGSNPIMDMERRITGFACSGRSIF